VLVVIDDGSEMSLDPQVEEAGQIIQDDAKALAGETSAEARASMLDDLKSEVRAWEQELCEPNSFTGSTHVLMADGSSKPLSKIKVGDRIANALPGEQPGTTDQAHTVTAVHVTHTDRDYTAVIVPGQSGASIVNGTARHLYWDVTTRAWTPANSLRIGDKL